jgi:hypothetical protein
MDVTVHIPDETAAGSLLPVAICRAALWKR